MKYGISDVYALKTATQEWVSDPDFIGDNTDKATIVLSAKAVNLLHKCVKSKNLEYLVLAQALLNLITELKGSAPASGTEHLYANVMENIFMSKEAHGLLVAKGILFQQKLSYIGNLKDIEDEMMSLGIYPYNEKKDSNYYIDNDIKNEMVKLSKQKGRFTYLSTKVNKI